MSTTPGKSCSAVSTTPAISSCHGFSVIAGVVDTGDKFIVDTGDQLSAVCHEGYFILPYNELAIPQGPKIQQKNKL
jgi:hypothetical protein